MATNDTKHADPPLSTPVRQSALASPFGASVVGYRAYGNDLPGYRYYLVHDEQSGAIEEVSKARYDEVVAEYKAYEWT